MDNVFHPFCDALKKMEIIHPQLYCRLEFKFFGTSSEEQRKYVKEHNIECVSFNDAVSLRETHVEINRADYCLLFLNNVYSFSLSTKFCEYIGLKKPVLLFSTKGKASDFIIENRLGYWMRPESTYDDLLNLIRGHDSSVNKTSEKPFDYSRFSIDQIVKEIEDFLI